MLSLLKLPKTDYKIDISRNVQILYWHWIAQLGRHLYCHIYGGSLRGFTM